MRKLLLGCVLAGAGLWASTAKAETNYVFDFGIGYQKLHIDGANAKELDGDENISGKFKVMILPSTTSRWRYGFSISGASAYENTGPFVFDGKTYVDDPFKEFEMLVPEFRIAYHIPINNLFIEPSIGVGPAIAAFRTGEDNDYWDADNTVRVNIALEPSLQIGYAQDQWAVGGEVSYLFTHLDFGDDVGGDIDTFYLGAFFRYQF